MAEEIIGVKVQVDASDVGKSVGSLKKQLREAQNEVTALSEKFGATSKEAINAAKKAAELKDRIGDAKALTDAFNPDAKFKALTASLSGVAGGFAALQGAVGLFGNKAEAVEKTLLKVQSAMALSQGLQAVGESIDSFKQLGAVVKTGVSNAFGTLRSAIISTGIGALVVGLGLLIANFETVKKVVLNFIPGLGKVADYIGNLVNKITDFVGITSEAERATAKLIKENDKAIKDGERNLELNGDKYDEYTQRKIKANLEFKKKQNEFKNDEQLTEEQKNAFILQARQKANREIAKADQDRNNAAIEANKKLSDKQKEIDDKLAADRKIRKEQEYNDFVQFVNDLKDSTNAELELQEFLISETKRKEQELFDWRVDLAQQRYDESEDEFAFLQELNKKKLEDDQKTLDARLNAQLQFTNAIGGVLSGLSGLFEQGTAASKVAALAEIGLGTATGFIQGLDIAQKGAKATGPAAPFAFPIFYASQIAAVLGAAGKAKQVLSQVKGGAGGVNLPSGSGIASAPVSPQLSTVNTVTQLNQASINQMGSATGRAYVVESDITNQQEKIIRINRAARLG
jgi:hypothetical protein